MCADKGSQKLTEMRTKFLKILRPYPARKFFMYADKGGQNMTELRKKRTSPFLDTTTALILTNLSLFLINHGTYTLTTCDHIGRDTITKKLKRAVINI